jgi:hypothetical protein
VRRDDDGDRDVARRVALQGRIYKSNRDASREVIDKRDSLNAKPKSEDWFSWRRRLAGATESRIASALFTDVGLRHGNLTAEVLRSF